MSSQIKDFPDPRLETYEPGLYVNFYCNLGEWWESKYYQSPKEARDNIDWERNGHAYQFTAKVTDKIYKFDRP